MKFFFPDSQDQIDPSFNFQTERRSVHRIRHRDDLYAHEVLGEDTFHGILISKAVIDSDKGTCRYTVAQRHRLYREGIRSFFRLKSDHMETIGDCGAFNYVKEEMPPFTVDEVIDFYDGCDLDIGVSVDHIILSYDASCLLPNPEWQKRQAITLELAESFLKRHRERKCRFVPMGAAQGWSPESYAESVRCLQEMGYQRIGLGGMVPLKTHEIISCLQAIDEIRDRDVQLHLFGITRCEHIPQFATYGVTSFDSTSPFRQAFKDARNNYYVMEGAYTAVRVPQVDGNAKLRRAIKSGAINQSVAIELEQRCLQLLEAYDREEESLENVLVALRDYEKLYGGEKQKDHTEVYRETLQSRAWKNCPCAICQEVGIHVILFRGSERNKRRGFHNLYVFSQRLRKELSK